MGGRERERERKRERERERDEKNQVVGGKKTNFIIYNSL